MMFEKANPVPASLRSAMAPHRQAPSAQASAAAESGERARFDARPARRAGEALRAVEWSEITARLNAARDLRMLLRTESRAPIEPVAASFGDAAASYFALLDHGEQEVNHDALGQSKALGAMCDDKDANRSGAATGEDAAAVHGDAREVQ